MEFGPDDLGTSCFRRFVRVARSVLLQYAARLLMAASTSDVCGRISSSRSGIIRDRAVHRGDAFDRRIEILEQLVADARGDLRAKPAGQLILVRDDARGWSA